MPYTANINTLSNVNPKTIRGKLDFDIGQVFVAKISKVDSNGVDVTLKTIDGWEFNATLQYPIDDYPQGLLKFVVTGNIDGKLILSPMQESKKDGNLSSSINELIKNSNMNLSEEDFNLLLKMAKSEIPLTKENINNIKNLLSFRENLIKDGGEFSNFIEEFINNIDFNKLNIKEVDVNNILKELCSTLVNADEDNLMLLLKNQVDISPENLKSFQGLLLNEDYKEIPKLLKSIIVDNINAQADINPKTIKSKLNFDLGQVFLAKVANVEFNDAGVTLKTIDGWEFSAALNAPLEEYPKGLVKFMVMGNEKGKLLLSPMQDIKKNGSLNPSIDEILKNNNMSLSEDDSELLLKMVRNEMPLTKDNITTVKNLFDFREKLIKDQSESSSFINKFIKNVDLSKLNIKPEDVDKILKEFCNTIRNTDEDTLMFLIKNQVDITPENINRFQKLFLTEDHKEISKLFQSIIKEAKGINEKPALDINDTLNIKKSIEAIKEAILKLKEDAGETSIKQNMPISFMERVQDIKLYNKLSEAYYYLELPLKYKGEDYDCSFIIKDERKRGKKIDSKDVKMVVTINTESLGNVDAYLKIYMNNLTLNLKCCNEAVGTLSKNKKMLEESLRSLGYNTKIDVLLRERKADIVSCEDFFNDKYLKTLNALV